MSGVDELGATPSKAVRGMVWAGLTLALSKGAMVVSTLVLARLLVPEDFGLFAVGLLVINYLDRLKDAGVGAALVYRKESWTRMAGTGLPLSMVSAAALAGLAYLAAPLAARFFREDGAEPLVQALAVVIFVSGLAVVPESRMRRELDFRRRLVPETAAAVVKGGVSIVLATQGFGVWSLVWGQVFGTAIQSVLYWAMAGWRPNLAWDTADAKLLLRFGFPTAAVAVLAVVVENLDYLIIGNRMTKGELGFYVLAYRMPELVTLSICIVASQVLFPYFSRLQDDLPALSQAYLSAVRKLALITIPVGLVLAVLSEEVVLTLYGSKWEPAVPVLAFLSLFAMVESLSFHAGDVYKATGRPGILNTMALVTLAVVTPALWVASSYNITAVAAAMLATGIVLTTLKLVVARGILSLPKGGLLRAFAPGAATGVITAGAVLLAQVLVSDLSPPARLAILSLVTVAAYLGALSVVVPHELRRAIQQLRSMLRREPHADASAEEGEQG